MKSLDKSGWRLLDLIIILRGVWKFQRKKEMLFIGIMLFITICANAQQYLGKSLIDARMYVKYEGYIPSEWQIIDDIHNFHFSTEVGYTTLYFKNRICVNELIYLTSYQTLNGVRNYLKKLNYKNTAKSTWINGSVKIKIGSVMVQGNLIYTLNITYT